MQPETNLAPGLALVQFENGTIKLDANQETLIAAAVIALICLLIGWLIGRIASQRRIATLEAMLKHEISSTEEHIAAMQDSFATLSGQALAQNNQQFLTLAKESLSRFHVQASSELAKRESAVENLIKPINDALGKTEQQLTALNLDRRQTQGAISAQLKESIDAQLLLRNETRNLVTALRRPEVRGRWGELTLRRVVELAGLSNHCDFSEQVNITTDDGAKLRPDAVIHLPGQRDIVIDVKTPLDAYINASEAKDNKQRAQFLSQHASQVRARIKELASKAYWQYFKHAPDFVVLFLPGEQFLHAALERDHTLLESALANKVVLATPASLIAILKTVEYSWRQQTLAENTEQIQTLAEDMFARFTIFSEHLAKLGKSMDAGFAQFNRVVGSFESKLLPASRRFASLGVNSAKETPEVQTVKNQPRHTNNPNES